MATNTIQQNTFIPAIGALPAGWGCTRVRNLFTEIVDRYDGKKDHFLPLLSVSEYYGVAERAEKIDEGDILVRASSLDGYKKCHTGDLVSNIMLTWRGALGVSPKDGIVSPAYCVYRPINGICGKYYHYLFRTQRYADIFKIHSTGLIDSRLRLYSAKFFAIKVPFPSLNEQEKIAKFLDEQCEKIDYICKEAQSSICEYKSWKSSIIYEAVTKGLNPNAEMKDSGIMWIGKIPAHWGIGRVKNCFVNHDEWREPISAENRENKLKLYDYYGASGPIDKIDFFNVDDTVLLIGEDGANLRMRNLPLVYKASGKFWVNNHAHILKVKEPNSYDFMAYLLEAGDYNEYITGSAQPKLSQFNLMRYPIPLVPPREQKEIETYLNRRCSKIDEIIEEKKALISDLESYKKSLIFEVVTGKRRIIS